MTIDESIAVLQAAKAGRQIQVRDRGEWRDIDIIQGQLPNFLSFDYRVKPEPRTVWVKERDGYLLYEAYQDRGNVCLQTGQRWVKFVEVIDE